MAWPSATPSSGGAQGGSSAGGSSAGDHGSSSGGGNPMAAFFAARQIVIDRMMRYFAAGICGLIAVFVVFHWARWLCVKIERSKTPAGVLGRPFVATSRLVRNLLVRKAPGFKSAGHVITVAAYVAINLAILLSQNDPISNIGNIAHRMGWIALGNMALVVFLALKNTPLAFLTAYSYERLNCLHHVAGYTMFAAVVVHAATYTAFFNSQGRLLSIYAEEQEIAGIVAGFALLGVIFSAMFLRRIWYEVFYVTHIASWIMLVVAVGFHQPEFANHTLIITVLAGSMWGLDRIIRAFRVLYYSANNEATLHPLPDGGTKIVLKKAPLGAKPGKHCFVWIPAIRKFETHPFTIHRSSPVEFTAKAQNGFTSDLHKYALEHPGVSVKASVDGPYGTFPDPMEFDKIVLIAGGGGATFTFGLAVNILERMDEDAPKNIVFIWSVKKHENLSWFREQLGLLRTHAHSPRVNVSLYVTRASSSISDSPSGNESSDNATRSDSSSEGGVESPPLSPVGADVEKDAIQIPSSSARRWPTAAENALEKEMGGTVETQVGKAGKDDLTATATVPRTYFEHAIKSGRPDAASLIRDAVKTTPRNQRVLVAACGPDGLMRIVRDTTAKLIVGDGPAVELHCEQFGW